MAMCIDGSVLEGGGQILRNAISFSALLSKPLTIENIRRGRSSPGLKNQHAAGIRLAAEICSASYSRVDVGSRSIDFFPGRIHSPGDFKADAVTAGSTALLLQIALPLLLFRTKLSDSPSFLADRSDDSNSSSILTLLGGTNAAMAPQADYAEHVLFPFLRRHLDLSDTLRVYTHRRGYYPKGGGIVVCSIPARSKPLPAVTLVERGMIIAVRGIAHVAGLPTLVAKQMAAGALDALVKAGLDGKIINIKEIREKNEKCGGAGSGIVLWAESEGGCVFGGSALGTKGKPPRDIGLEAALELARGLDKEVCVDEYMQDQLIIFLALAEGKSTIKTGPLTLHTKTAIWVAEQMSGAKFSIEEDYVSGHCIIHCEGIGFKA